MADDIYIDPLDKLLLSKSIHPLSSEENQQIVRIQNLNISDFTEDEVRFSVINPIVKILGYDKDKNFSVDLGRSLKVFGRRRAPDFKLNLWERDFWLIEAKKPASRKSFESKVLRQAVEYSIIPEINAALVVLCDGDIWEVYDREVDLNEPILRIEKRNLVRDFHLLRKLLEPMQIFFFQKRRIIRHLDKAFDLEFNLSRVNEFKSLIDRRLEAKARTVLENHRTVYQKDTEDQVQAVEKADHEELVESYFFDEPRKRIYPAAIRRLVENSHHSSFSTMHRIFPDYPRDVNDAYFAQALIYLIRLQEKRETVEWIPAWLAQGGTQSDVKLDKVITFLLGQCLSNFEGIKDYRIILAAYNAIRRINKVMMIGDMELRRRGVEHYALARYLMPEISWSQVVASPEASLLHFIDNFSRLGIREFVRSHRGARGNFLTTSAYENLKQIWHAEKTLLNGFESYIALRADRSLGDTKSVEWCGLGYDDLGHMTLCLLNKIDGWKERALKLYKPSIEALAKMGSWSAKEYLSLPLETDVGSISDDELAERFFFGDVGLYRDLRQMYSK